MKFTATAQSILTSIEDARCAIDAKNKTPIQKEIKITVSSERATITGASPDQSIVSIIDGASNLNAGSAVLPPEKLHKLISIQDKDAVVEVEKKTSGDTVQDAGKLSVRIDGKKPYSFQLHASDSYPDPITTASSGEEAATTFDLRKMFGSVKHIVSSTANKPVRVKSTHEYVSVVGMDSFRASKATKNAGFGDADIIIPLSSMELLLRNPIDKVKWTSRTITVEGSGGSATSRLSNQTMQDVDVLIDQVTSGGENDITMKLADLKNAIRSIMAVSEPGTPVVLILSENEMLLDVSSDMAAGSETVSITGGPETSVSLKLNGTFFQQAVESVIAGEEITMDWTTPTSPVILKGEKEGITSLELIALIG